MWDLFCKVVDNYGDVGVCWRLSRQLVAEHGAGVRLWIDDLDALVRIWPGVDRDALVQSCAGVEIRRWTGDAAIGVSPGYVVIEAFGCEVPAAFVSAMAARPRQPAWYNLEYLSAEDWVEGCHLLPSPHPRLPLVKYFYFPGFTQKTGGLLREAGLFAARDAFRDAAEPGLWHSLGVPGRSDRELRVSLFAYRNAAALDLFGAWSAGALPLTCLVPDGVLVDEIQTYCGALPPLGAEVVRGSLRLIRIPFVNQSDYDRLLWSCDLNFVRGEDSFVRAQWAGLPFVWHIYPQSHDAHRPKLAAFVRRHAELLDADVRAGVEALFRAWNGDGNVADAWRGVAHRFEQWNAGAAAWATHLAAQRDLASALAEDAADRL